VFDRRVAISALWVNRLNASVLWSLKFFDCIWSWTEKLTTVLHSSVRFGACYITRRWGLVSSDRGGSVERVILIAIRITRSTCDGLLAVSKITLRIWASRNECQLILTSAFQGRKSWNVADGYPEDGDSIFFRNATIHLPIANNITTCRISKSHVVSTIS
jgi:hypothetical protein